MQYKIKQKKQKKKINKQKIQKIKKSKIIAKDRREGQRRHLWGVVKRKYGYLFVGSKETNDLIISVTNKERTIDELFEEIDLREKDFFNRIKKEEEEYSLMV